MYAQTAEEILRRRWKELTQLQQSAEADECEMAEAVLLPQPGALPLAGGMSLVGLFDFVPSTAELAGQFEQSFREFAVKSFQWAVRNMMLAAQTDDAKLRETHQQLAHWYAGRAAQLTRELKRFHRAVAKHEGSAKTAASTVSSLDCPLGSAVGIGEAAFDACNFIATPSVLLGPDIAP